MSEVRINVRLDKQTSQDLCFLRQEFNDKSITDIVKYSLHKAAQKLREKTTAKTQKQIWLDSGFVDGFESYKDLSSNYKHYLADIIDEKYSAE